MEAAVKTFFSSPRFAVAGASSDTSKFGYKIFAWYISHNLPATPLNPSQPTVTVRNSSYNTLASPSALGNIAPKTSLSVITPPKVTRKILEEAKAAGVKAVWLQPGSFDREGLEYAREQWPGAAVAGTDVEGSRSAIGWCVLADGDRGLEMVGRERAKL